MGRLEIEAAEVDALVLYELDAQELDLVMIQCL